MFCSTFACNDADKEPTAAVTSDASQASEEAVFSHISECEQKGDRHGNGKLCSIHLS